MTDPVSYSRDVSEQDRAFVDERSPRDDYSCGGLLTPATRNEISTMV
jgi:hypothetical protein